MNRIKTKMGGRPPKIDPAKNRISINLSDVEYADFLTLYEKSGVHSIVYSATYNYDNKVDNPFSAATLGKFVGSEALEKKQFRKLTQVTVIINIFVGAIY